MEAKNFKAFLHNGPNMTITVNTPKTISIFEVVTLPLSSAFQFILQIENPVH